MLVPVACDRWQQGWSHWSVRIKETKKTPHNRWVISELNQGRHSLELVKFSCEIYRDRKVLGLGLGFCKHDYLVEVVLG